MKRRDFLYGLGGAGVLTATGLPKLALAAGSGRGLRIVVDDEAPQTIKEAAHALAEAQDHPLLTAMSEGKRDVVSSRHLLAGPLTERAYNHLVLVGLPTDPMIATAWQREARQRPDGFYIFGFGSFKGDIGYIESDRNLFLHSPGVSVAPYETEIVTITGSTPAGVELACGAFRTRHLVNGVVAAPGWTRGTLDREPLAPEFVPPALTPERVGPYTRIGLTQASEDEYRGVLADTGVTPALIWRAKYYVAGAWDKPGSVNAFDNYSFGLHRRAYGNTRWVAGFGSGAEAAEAAPKIARAAQLTANGARWTGLQPYYADARTVGSMNRGPLALWVDGADVAMSTVPGD
jgi:hypothetical protein